MTPWVLRLLIANVAVFFVTAAQPEVARLLAYVPALTLSRPWTPITYMFVHANFAHLLFNMIGLFFFGPRLEHHLGRRSFLLLYFVSGLGGAIFSLLFQPGVGVVGASGAVYGVLFAFAYLWPRENIYIWGVLPIQARWLAVMLVAVSLYSGITGSASGVAHFAHLGGVALGFGYLWWHRRRRRTARKRSAKTSPGSALTARLKNRRSLDRWRSISVDHLHELNRQEVRSLLRKVEDEGVQSLSPQERAFLDRMAESSSS